MGIGNLQNEADLRRFIVSVLSDPGSYPKKPEPSPKDAGDNAWKTYVLNATSSYSIPLLNAQSVVAYEVILAAQWASVTADGYVYLCINGDTSSNYTFVEKGGYYDGTTHEFLDGGTSGGLPIARSHYNSPGTIAVQGLLMTANMPDSGSPKFWIGHHTFRRNGTEIFFKGDGSEYNNSGAVTSVLINVPNGSLTGHLAIRPVFAAGN